MHINYINIFGLFESRSLYYVALAVRGLSMKTRPLFTALSGFLLASVFQVLTLA